MAVFAAERRPRLSWLQVMDEWNKGNHADIYSDHDRFKRECTDAQKRLLKPARANDEFMRSAQAQPSTVVEIKLRSTQEAKLGRD